MIQTFFSRFWRGIGPGFDFSISTCGIMVAEFIAGFSCKDDSVIEEVVAAPVSCLGPVRVLAPLTTDDTRTAEPSIVLSLPKLNKAAAQKTMSV
jgi:hypothetical protein